MKIVKLAICLIILGIGGKLQAQDLLQRVPADAKVVMAINGKAFFKHVDVSEMNNLFKNFGFFKNVIGKKSKVTSENLEDFGIDIKSKAYVYMQITDSLQYVGSLIPLSNSSQFESLIPDTKKIENVNGLKTIYNNNKTMRVSWDNQNLYILNGIAMDNHFSRKVNQDRYGMLEESSYEDVTATDDHYDYSVVEAAPDTVITEEWTEEELEAMEEAAKAAEEAAEQAEEATEVVESTNEVNVAVPPPAAAPPAVIVSPDDFDQVDSVLDSEEYQDDYYLQYRKIRNHNDSIKNTLVAKWVNEHFTQLLSNQGNSYQSKTLQNLKDNELVRVEVKEINDFYKYYYPMDIMYSAFGTAFKFDTGIKSLASSIVVDGNTMKMVGDMEVDKELTKYYKEIYKHKLNPKFYNFLDEKALGFASININSEAYIKHLPTLVNKYYGSMGDNKVAKGLELMSTIFDVALDEKALAKVMKGDHLLVFNGVTKTKVTYTDYEYDDDYNAKEVQRTKTENVPQFMWMFSSDDTRIYQQILNLAKSEGAGTDRDGIFELKFDKSTGIVPHILIDKGIVFISNDLEKLQAIKNNQFRGKGHSEFVNMAKKNNIAVVFNTKQVPVLIDELDLPVHRSMEETVNELSQYGNFYYLNGKMKGNHLPFELGLDFPKTKSNAVSFLIDALNKISLRLND